MPSPPMKQIQAKGSSETPVTIYQPALFRVSEEFRVAIETNRAEEGSDLEVLKTGTKVVYIANICIRILWEELYWEKKQFAPDSGAKSERKNRIARTELSFFLVSNSISSFLSRLIYTCQIYVAAQGSHFRFVAGNYNLHLNSSISSRFLESSGAPSPISCSSSRIDMIIWSVFYLKLFLSILILQMALNTESNGLSVTSLFQTSSNLR